MIFLRYFASEVHLPGLSTDLWDVPCSQEGHRRRRPAHDPSIILSLGTGEFFPGQSVTWAPGVPLWP